MLHNARISLIFLSTGIAKHEYYGVIWAEIFSQTSPCCKILRELQVYYYVIFYSTVAALQSYYSSISKEKQEIRFSSCQTQHFLRQPSCFMHHCLISDWNTTANSCISASFSATLNGGSKPRGLKHSWEFT